MANKYGLALDSGEFVPAEELNTTQPEALRLAEGLESIFISEEIHATKAQKIAAELRRLHARIADLESQLVKEAARSADEKRRADQMTEQHRMQAAMNAEARAKLASIGAGYTAADMATAAAQGFRDGVASAAASAGSEPVAHLWQHSETGRTRVVMPDMVVDASATWLPVGPLYLHPSPPEGMVGGWVSVEERLPESDAPVLAHNGKWTGVAAWMSGDYLEPLERWQDEHREFIEMMGPAITHWMPLPPPPSSAKGVAHG